MKLKTVIKNTAIMLVLTGLYTAYQLHAHGDKITDIKQDPNIVHIEEPQAPAGDDLTEIFKQLLDTTPQYNKFPEKSVVVVDRHTNTFYMNGINKNAFYAFEKESTLMAVNGVKEITLNLHSPGGSVWYAGYIIDQIRILKDRGVKVRTVIDDQNACMSACPLIFLEGDERIASANSVIMIHAPYIIFPSDTPEAVIVNEQRVLRRDREEFANKFASVCPDHQDIKMDIYDHGDHYYRVDDLAVKCSKFFTVVLPATKNPVGEQTLEDLLGATFPSLQQEDI